MWPNAAELVGRISHDADCPESLHTSVLDTHKNTFPSDIRNCSTIDDTDWIGQKEWDSASQLDYLDYFT